MLEVVGNVGTGAGGAFRAAGSAAPTSAENTGSSTGVTRVPLSPRMKADPEAGIVIAEYLSSSGEKSMQIPSETVVAYLRSGLSADGSPMKDQSTLATEA